MKDVQFSFENFFLKKFVLFLKVGILPVKTLFPRMKFCCFFSNFGRPPCSARIFIKLWREMNISKFGFGNVTRILPSENYFIQKCSVKMPFYPSNCQEVLLFFSPLFDFLFLFCLFIKSRRSLLHLPPWARNKTPGSISTRAA